MNGCMANPTNAHAHDPVVWLRAFILAQLQLGLVDARMAEVALHMVEQLRMASQMAKMAQAVLNPPARPHETAKVRPLPAAGSSAFLLHEHFSREGTPLREETEADRRHRREVANWRERPVEELLADMKRRKASRLAAAA